MADEIAKIMEKQRQELVAAGEIGPDEKLSIREISKRYTLYMIKQSQGGAKSPGTTASDKSGVKPAAQSKAPLDERPASKKETQPGEMPAVVKAKPAEPKKEDSIEAKLQGQYHDALDKLLAPWDKIRGLMEQHQKRFVETLRSEDPVLAEEYSKFQASLAEAANKNMDEKEFIEVAQKNGEAVQMSFQKHLSSPGNLQKRLDLLSAEYQKTMGETEKLHLEMEERAKEMVSFFEKSAGGVKK
jgi:hypothetical protein